VEPHLQSTTNPAVWAAGDAAATPGMPLTPVAVFEGKVAASNMLKDQTTAPGYDGVPTVVYTIPELARVGMLESEARQAGIDLDVRQRDTGDWFSNYRIGERTAATKILVDRDSDTIVGAHMFGPEYGELVSPSRDGCNSAVNHNHVVRSEESSDHARESTDHRRA
jgi:glutathione reductase (NADPH)